MEFNFTGFILDRKEQTKFYHIKNSKNVKVNLFKIIANFRHPENIVAVRIMQKQEIL